MKICKLSYYDHPVLRSFTLNIFKSDGTPYDTVVFAGENGSGKTIILDSLFKYFSGYPLSDINEPIKPTDARIELEVVFDEIEGMADDSGNIIHKAKVATGIDDSTQIRVRTQFFYNDDSTANVAGIPPTAARAIYSQIAINYNADNVSAASGNDLDKINNRTDKSTNNLATEIKQLFIDIHKEDSSELSQWVDEHKNEIVPPEIQHKRIKRFSGAFERIFGDKLKFKGVQGLNVLFEKNGQQVSIDQLSSGEKQIVFRGGFLLRNHGAMNGATVLLDEPELSMHPKWQEKILGFYRTLFTDNVGLQTSQLFIATHSDHVIKSALENDNTLIVLLKTGASPEYIHKGDRGMVLKTVTLAEVKWRIFDLPTTDFHDQLWSELSYDDSTNKVKKVTELDRELVNAASGDTSKLKKWIGYQADSTQPYGRRHNAGYNTSSLSAYIRNYMHHPEFTDINNVAENTAYTDDELRNSIEFMIKRITSH